jgi:organic radical activating enzyme
MVKTRIFSEHNYKAFWFNGKTIRSAIDIKRTITELQYPEFYDVKITGYCEGACPWCYMNSTQSLDDHYEHAVEKIKGFFGALTQNQRPFQVAIGGGEPTAHPDFIDILRTFKGLGIEPNYTTNGMWISYEIVNATKKLCGGVAVSCHPHLQFHWRKSALRYIEKEIPLNFHLIISDRDSIDYFVEIYKQWQDNIDYFVLLPYVPQGRATEKNIDWEYLIENMPQHTHKIAFGAGFYPYLLQQSHNIKVSLYEPEIMSKFLDLKDMKLYSSSFATNIS